jgi:hypothetical protein
VLVAFTELELRRIDRVIGGLCRRRSRPEFADRLRLAYEVDGHAVSIYEERAPWDGRGGDWTRMGVARFRYTRSTGVWKLYWMRRDLKWHAYELDPSVAPIDLEELVRTVEEDEHCAFFG